MRRHGNGEFWLSLLVLATMYVGSLATEESGRLNDPADLPADVLLTNGGAKTLILSTISLVGAVVVNALYL